MLFPLVLKYKILVKDGLNKNINVLDFLRKELSLSGVDRIKVNRRSNSIYFTNRIFMQKRAAPCHADSGYINYIKNLKIIYFKFNFYRFTLFISLLYIVFLILIFTRIDPSFPAVLILLGFLWLYGGNVLFRYLMLRSYIKRIEIKINNL